MGQVTTELPDTVRQALGPAAAHDLAVWLDQRLPHTEDQVPISALVARQKVNVLMLEQVSNLLLADDPKLVQLPDGKWVWRVPVDLTFPSQGRAGRVGELDVDAHYGQVIYSDAVLAEIGNAARRLAKQALHPTA